MVDSAFLSTIDPCLSLIHLACIVVIQVHNQHRKTFLLAASPSLDEDCSMSRIHCSFLVHEDKRPNCGAMDGIYALTLISIARDAISH